MAQEHDQPPVAFDKDALPPGHWFTCLGDNQHVHYVLEGKSRPACKRSSFRDPIRRDLYIPEHLSYCPGCVKVVTKPKRTRAPRPIDVLTDAIARGAYDMPKGNGYTATIAWGLVNLQYGEREAKVTPEEIKALAEEVTAMYVDWRKAVGQKLHVPRKLETIWSGLVDWRKKVKKAEILEPIRALSPAQMKEYERTHPMRHPIPGPGRDGTKGAKPNGSTVLE